MLTPHHHCTSTKPPKALRMQSRRVCVMQRWQLQPAARLEDQTRATTRMATGNRRKRKRKRQSELLWTTRSTFTCTSLLTQLPTRRQDFSAETKCLFFTQKSGVIDCYWSYIPKLAQKSCSTHTMTCIKMSVFRLYLCNRATTPLTGSEHPHALSIVPHSPRLIDEDSPYGLGWVASNLTKVKFSTDKNSEVSEMRRSRESAIVLTPPSLPP